MFTSYMLNIVLKEAVSITLPLGSCLCLRQHFVGKKKKDKTSDLQTSVGCNPDSLFWFSRDF